MNHKVNGENQNKLYAFLFEQVTFWKRKKHECNTNIMDFQKIEERPIRIGFQDGESTVHAARMTGDCHCTFVQAQIMHTTRSKPKGQLWTLSDNGGVK